MTERRDTLLGHMHKMLFAMRLANRCKGWPQANNALPVAGDVVRLSGFFDEALGIGSAAALTATALEDAGMKIIREDLRRLHRRLLTRKPEPFSQPSDARIWLIHANPPEANIALFARDVADWQALYRIAYWTWESSLAPTHWLGTARWFHEIWVPAPSVRDAFSDAFARSSWPEAATKLRVIPHPVYPIPSRIKKTNKLKALTLFDPRSDLLRKNPVGAIDAWIRAFPTPAPDANLVVKCLPFEHEAIAELRARISGRPDIEIRCEELSREQTEALIAESDIVLSLHRGEGFGLTLAEAMTAGCVVIATGWSGNMAFMTPENSVPVPYRMIPANKRHNGPEALWAEPDIDAAAQAIRAVAADTALRMRLGYQARSDSTRLRQIWAADIIRQSA